MDAQSAFGEDKGTRMPCHREALISANRILKIVPPESYEDAMKLRPHEYIHRQIGRRLINTTTSEGKDSQDGVLYLVTSDGKKYQFPVPVSDDKKD